MGVAKLCFHLFGSLRIAGGDHEVVVRSASARAILAYLALCPGHAEDRGRLAATIWETSENTRARQNLRQALHALTRPAGTIGQAIIADRGLVGLSPDLVVTDVNLLLGEIEAGRVPDGIKTGALQPDRLLSDEPPRGDLFDSWLRLQRRDLENRMREGLSGLLGQRDQATARGAAEALLALDPADEQAVRFLIRHYHAAGQTARALRAYEKLWNHLEQEYDAEPGAETVALIAQIKAQEPAVIPGGPVRRTELLRIGLAPVVAGGSSYAAGVGCLFRAELMATLLRFRAFEIVDQGLPHDPVDYVLDVSIGGDDRELLLLAVLKRGSDGTALWSDRWTGIADRWLQTQAGIVSRLASSLSIYVSLARVQELQRTEFRAGAFDDWLMGNMRLDEFRAEGRAAAARCFQSVIEKAPKASIGYSSLSRLMNSMHLMQPGMFRQNKTHRESKALASKAVALDPLDSQAHLHRAWACCMLGEYDQASAGYAMARQCNPNDPWTMLSSGLGAAFADDLPLATELSARVIREGWTTAPFQWGFHMPIRFLAGDFEGCVAAADNAGTSIINVPAWKAAALWHLDRKDEAQASWAEFEALSRTGWSGDVEADARSICAWYLSCFPVRNAAQRRRMAEGATGAAGLQLHCVQQYPAR